MKAMDEKTRLTIDKIVAKTVQQVGFKQPPILIDPILQELEVNRNFVDLEDANLLGKVKNILRIGGAILVNILEKIKLEGLWFPKEETILVQKSLPGPKIDWASFHELNHGLLPWHRPYFLGDTAQTLDPDFQEMLENEANYGASALMFGGLMFTKEAVDTLPGWKSIKMLQKRYKKSLVTTTRRYVGFSHSIPMSLVISTPWWMEKPEEQNDRIRHLVLSDQFRREFGNINREGILNLIDKYASMRKGGIVGEFQFRMKDLNGNFHEFHAESFFNVHYLLTLITLKGQN
ncbi:MAG: hypothetical protein A2Y71_08865 [Bacteroidetes bacterium RBG_13_42_15]|nr:MAG: hypothetical protein A2Y71_08865 [Bacteroidetes bacterium RBG_13_42_15]